MNELTSDKPYQKRLEELFEKSHELFKKIYGINGAGWNYSLWKERKAVVDEMEDICEKYNLDEYGKPKNDMKK